MAGFIFINDDDGLSVNSMTFNAIAEFTRPFFATTDKVYIDEVYAPLDEGGMDMLSLADQNVIGFNAYFRGISRAYNECLKAGKCGQLADNYFDMVMKSWSELIELLENDSRFSKPE